MTLKELIIRALHQTVSESGQLLPQDAVLIWCKDPVKAECDSAYEGVTVIYAPTIANPTLGRCSWIQARIFEEWISGFREQQAQLEQAEEVDRLTRERTGDE